MKRYQFFIFILLFFLSFPVDVFGEDWGVDGRNVDEMLEAEREESIDGEETVNEANVENNESIINDDVENEQLQFDTQGQSVFMLLLQIFFALAIIIFLIYVLLKLFHKRSKQFGSHSTIANIGGVSLGQNKSVQIVRIGDKLYVLGVGDSVQLIKEISNRDEVDKILAEREQDVLFDQPMTKLSDWFKKRFFEKNDSQQEHSFQQLLKRELKEVKESQKKVHSLLKEKNDD